MFIDSDNDQTCVTLTMFSKSILLVFITFIIYETKCELKVFDSKSCELGPLVKEIESYDGVVRKILNYTVSGPFKGKTYDE